MNSESLLKANNIIDGMNKESNIKRIKSESGLIEQYEINKVVLTEDNKILLKG